MVSTRTGAYRGRAYFEVTSVVDENVLGFEISIDEVEKVEVLEAEDDLRRVKARVGLPETVALVCHAQNSLPMFRLDASFKTTCTLLSRHNGNRSFFKKKMDCVVI